MLVAGLLLELAACSPRLPAGSSRAAASSRTTPTKATGGSARTGANAKDATANASPAGGQAGAKQQSSPGNPHPGGPASAYVNFVTGNVTARTSSSANANAAGEPAAQRVRVADTVSSGEIITTEKGSAAEIRVGDLFDVGLGERASLRFDEVAAASGAGSNRRLVLTLEKGALQLKAGSEYISATSGSTSSPVILEVHTPHLFVSSRGGSLLVTEEVDSTLCAVGRGRAWLLPESVVYSNLVKTVENPAALQQLGSILSQAVAVGRHEEIAVPAVRLAKIDGVGRAIREILISTKGEKSYARTTGARFNKLAAEAAQEVASAIGKPEALSKELRAELDPQSIHHQKMKTVSSTETGPSTPATGSTNQKSAKSAEQPDVAHTPGYAPPAASTKGAPGAGPSVSSTPTSPAGSSSSVTSAVGSLLSNLFGSSSGGRSSSGPSSSGSQGATTSSADGAIPGPAPPTPPVPPSAPK